MPDAKKGIKYHSKSPDEILEEIVEKEDERGTKRKFRKKASLFLVFNVLIIIVFLLSWYLYNRNMPEFPHIKKVYNAVFRIVCADNFLYGEPLSAVIKVSNSVSNKIEIQIDDFQFEIKDLNENNVFYFRYPLQVDVTLEKFDSREVYNFERENPFYFLNPGKYKLISSLKINSKEILLEKEFTVEEKITVEYTLLEDFYLPEEEFTPFLRLKNNSPLSKTYKLGNYRQTIELEGISFDSISGNFSDGEITLYSQEKFDIELGKLKAPTSPGIYEIKYNFFLNGEINQGTSTLIVNNLSSDYDISKIRILPYSLKVIGEGEPYEAEILLVNDIDNEFFETIESVKFSIGSENSELFRYLSDRKLNIYLPPYSKRTVFISNEWRKIEIPSTGKYQMKIDIQLKGGSLHKEEELYVAPKTERKGD